MSDERREERGVQNPSVVDLITRDRESGEVVLVALERRPWTDPDQKMPQLREKLNSYFAYALDGHLERDYPQYAGLRVRLQLECLEPPGEAEQPVLREATLIAARHGLRFSTHVMDDPAAFRAPWE